ncbi:MAG: transporter substrate-binding domain-containing protein [Desulfobacterales bacterium]|nr:transporter substrate-binding domain-containing protein [Desulfobacterales bacterium]
MKKFFLVLVILIFASSTYAAGIKEVKLVTQEWSGYTQSDGSGLYFEVLKEIFEAEDIEIKITLVPWNEAIETVIATGDALVGVSTFNEFEGLIQGKWFIDTGYVTIVYKKGTNFSGESSLKGKTIGWLKGYNFGQQISLDSMDYERYELESLDSGMTMLKNSAIHFLLGYKTNLIEAANKAGIDLTGFELVRFLEEDTTVAFTDDSRGKKLRKIYDKGMKRLKKSGRLDEIYIKYGYDGYVK